VAVHYGASEAEAEATAAAIRAKGVRAAAMKANLAKENETQALLAKARTALGPITALVNSASIFQNDSIETMTRESWDTHIETNLRAPLVLAQNFARELPPNSEGAIVNLLDQRLFKPTPQFLSYSASKAGLHWLTTTLAQALAPRIRVNGVAPGPTLRGTRQSEADFQRQTEATPLRRGASPADIGAAVRYLLEAPAVTGQTIVVDGGQYLIWQTPDVMRPE
jgi:NAD(P)-dependent dehydrogenase (short-subunit alcohol dehydrogenase family)